eukprot:5438795-Alexandrium_andersonii.AAC.1
MRRAPSLPLTAADACLSWMALNPAWPASARLCCGRTAQHLAPTGCHTSCSTSAATSLRSSWARPSMPAGWGM